MSSKTGDSAQVPATTSLLAAATTDPKDWVLALSMPCDAAAPEGKISFPSESAGDPALENARPGRPRGESATSSTGALTSSVPLEERITVAQLQIIMEGFNSDTVATPLQTTAPANPVEDQRAATPGLLASTQRNRLQGTEEKKTTAHARHDVSAATATAAAAAASGSNFKDPSPSGSPKRRSSSPDEPPMLSFVKMNKKARYDRKLPQEAFVELIHRVLPNTTTEEVIELMKKVDYDGQGVVTWQELSTFFASQNRRRAYLSNVKMQYNESPQPVNCAPALQHTQITCYTISPNKKLLLTGGTDGVVHAWGMDSLAYRGLIFSIDDWIIGLHYHHKGRFIYIVAMDRAVYIVDANSFEVTRMYRGRAMGDSSDRVLFAERTTRTVKVGGAGSSRRGVPPSTSNKPIYTTNVNAASSGSNNNTRMFQLDQLQKQLATAPHTVLTTGLAMQSLSRADGSRLTSPGSGPYVERTVEEGVLVGLVDPIMSSLYHNTVLDEDVLLLGTSVGDVYLFVFPSNALKTVLSPKRTMRLHTDAVHKMTFYYPLYALASCSEDGTVKMTSMVTGQTLHQFAGPSGGDKGNKMFFRSAAGAGAGGGDGASATTSCEDGHAAVRDFAIHPRQKLLVTVGPERNGLVWDFAQEKPVAALDAHNAPCRCCAVSLSLDEIITVDADGVFQSFDCNGFHTVQKINLDAGHRPFLFVEPENSQRLLFFGKYPFHLRAKRQDSDDCPASYTGHYSTMLDALYSRTFSHIITVDTDALAMTWEMTGKNVFSFVLKDFSDSATMNAARLTCVALDGLQRRVITGFNNGAVVVWNAANGQPINFLSAAVSDGSGNGGGGGGSFDGATVDSAALEKEKEDLKRRPWRAANSQKGGGGGNSALQPSNSRGGSEEADGSSGGGGGGGNAADVGGDGIGSLTSDVTAVGSLVRRGATFFVFACRQHLYTVRESSNFTVAAATKWPVPEMYGTTNTITQLGEHLVACGTSTGAIVCYHVLSERQDGAPLFVKDLGAINALLGDLAQPAGATTNGRRGRQLNTTTGGLRSRHMSASQSLMGASMTFSSSHVGSVAGASAKGPAAGGAAPHLTSGVIRIMQLPVVNEHLFLSLHADGTMAFWQSFRRLNVGTVSLAAAGVAERAEEGEEEDTAANLVAEVDSRNRYLVFADEDANVHICTFHFMALNQREEAEALLLDNPVTYTMWRAEQAELNETVPINHTLASANTSLEEPSVDEGQGGEKAAAKEQEAKRRVCVPDVFKRVNAFGTGLGSIVRILLIDPHPPHVSTTTTTTTITTAALEKNNAEDADKEDDNGNDKNSSEDASYRPLIICVGANRYTRAFNFSGEMVGDFGTATWSVDDFALEGNNLNVKGGLRSTEARRRFPCFIAKKDEGDATELSSTGALDSHEYDFDYLEDALLLQQLRSMNSRKPRSKSANRRSSLGSTMPAPTTSVVQIANALRPTTPQKNTTAGGGTTPTMVEPVPLADALRTLNTSSGPHFDDGDENKNATEDNNGAAGNANINNDNGNGTAGAEPSQISTVIKQSTRQRYLNEPKYKGIIKKDFAAQIRQKAAMELVHDSAAKGRDAAMLAGGTSRPDDPFAGPMEDTTSSGLMAAGSSSGGGWSPDGHLRQDSRGGGGGGGNNVAAPPLMRFDAATNVEPPMDLKSPSAISSPAFSDISVDDDDNNTAVGAATGVKGAPPPPRRQSACDGYTNPCTPHGRDSSLGTDMDSKASTTPARHLKTNSPPPSFSKLRSTEQQQQQQLLPSVKARGVIDGGSGAGTGGANTNNVDGTLPLVLKRPQREASFVKAIRRISTAANENANTPPSKSPPNAAATAAAFGSPSIGFNATGARRIGGGNANTGAGGGKKAGMVQVKEQKEETPEALIQQNLSLFREKLMKDLKYNEQFNAENGGNIINAGNINTNNNNNNSSGGDASNKKGGGAKAAGTAVGGSSEMQERVRQVLSGKHKTANRSNYNGATNFLDSAQGKDNRSYLERMYVAPVDTAASLSFEKQMQQGEAAAAEGKEQPPHDT